MARKHECPECGASHDMSAEGRIRRLEERVKELEAEQSHHHCGLYCNHAYWWTAPYRYYPTGINTGTTTWQPTTTVVYDATTAPASTFTLTS